MRRALSYAPVIALDKAEATRTLTGIRRQWFNKRKSVSALLREVL
jgi:type IV secretion system protein VirB4